MTTTLERPVGFTRLRDFVVALADVVSGAREEVDILQAGSKLLAGLVAHDDWLPDAFSQAHPDRYQQYLLHCDSRERFSVVSFVWGPGQGTPIHDHRVWGLIGMLRGREQAEHYDVAPDGRLIGMGHGAVLQPGEVEAVSPRVGDIHRVWNAQSDAPSISIHVYGGNIGAVERATYGLGGAAKPFISGYANTLLPNLWDKSA